MRPSLLTLVLCASLSGCAGSNQPQWQREVELKRFPLDSLEEVRATTGLSFDRTVSHDGKGSLRVDTKEPLVVPLFEVTDLSIENAVLLYEAALRSEKLDGQAYLEMWVRFPGKGEFFSRGLNRPMTGTMSWLTISTPFFLQEGQKPDLIRLNLVVSGSGRVWIDDVRLLRRPLPGR
jgi:hypothetical protein